MSDRADLIIEIGTEELPPKSLSGLGEALVREFGNALAQNRLEFASLKGFYTPRRLAVLVKGLARSQEDIEQIRKGPADAAAIDATGAPTKALEGFARSCKAGISELEIQTTAKGKRYCYRSRIKGQATEKLIPIILQNALEKLPIAKRMRWGSHTEDFVRPVHWLLAVFANQVIPFCMFDIHAGAVSYGHRFHHPQAIKIEDPASYESRLEAAFVIADFTKRKAKIRQQVEAEANKLDACARIDEDLLDEVTSLVEYPVAAAGSFAEKFLEVPPEAIISFMQDHQKFFPVIRDAKLVPAFITVSNIDSKNMDIVREGNERVIRPRLTDALFFWQQDLKQGLTGMGHELAAVVYQERLGSIQDRVARVTGLALFIADRIGADVANTRRAANLSKSDLLSAMVGEFPKLQGIMGRYYAVAAGEDPEVAQAIEEQYLPRFSGDKIPTSIIGKALALADKIDTLVGIFGIDLAPTGDKDPFALRRAAISILRIISEGGLILNLRALLEYAAELLGSLIKDDASDKVLGFVMERFKHLRMEQGTISDVFDAVRAAGVLDIVDFIKRELALGDFLQDKAALSLSAANKRIDNLLKKSQVMTGGKIDANLFVEDQELVLHEAFNQVSAAVSNAVAAANYAKALNLLASLRDPINEYFDKVMVMTEDKTIKHNRLALLAEVRRLFLQVADISKITTTRD